MKKRQKASDLFDEAGFFYGRKANFNEAFPEIDEASASVEEFGKGAAGGRRRIFDKNNLGQYIDCSNPLCYGGGADIGRFLRTMIANGKTHDETTLPCMGDEGSPKGKKIRHKCLNEFKISIDIKYK
jgi:hypothetical protein